MAFILNSYLIYDIPQPTSPPYFPYVPFVLVLIVVHIPPRYQFADLVCAVEGFILRAGFLGSRQGTAVEGNIVDSHTCVVATLVFLKYQLNKFSIRDVQRQTERTRERRREIQIKKERKRQVKNINGNMPIAHQLHIPLVFFQISTKQIQYQRFIETERREQDRGGERYR